MNQLISAIGKAIASFLEKPSRNYSNFSVTDVDVLSRILQPGDILLIEGNLRLSIAIKYLTQSTWSHAAIYVGDCLERKAENGEALTLVEAELSEGVIAVPLSKYASFNTRICRPFNLREEDRRQVVDFVVQRLGFRYDIKNVIDLLRYLFPTPPVPVRWRRRLLALGSGDPTRAICSTLIAQAYQSVLYPILPGHTKLKATGDNYGTYTKKEVLHIRHHSLFTPRDFDLSPYFMVVKPTLENGFDYTKVVWNVEQAEVMEDTKQLNSRISD